MALSVWPSDLPQRLSREGFSYAFADGRLKTAMDAGPPKMRRRFSSAVKPVTIGFMGDANAMARLERFWAEVGDGTLPWLMPDQTNDGLPIADDEGAPILSGNGSPIALSSWWVVQFGDSPPQKTNIAGPLYRVTFPLNILP